MFLSNLLKSPTIPISTTVPGTFCCSHLQLFAFTLFIYTTVENHLNLQAPRPWHIQLLLKQEDGQASQSSKHSQTLTTRTGLEVFLLLSFFFFSVVNNWWIRAFQIYYSCQSLPVVIVVAGPKHVCSGCSGIIIWLFRLGTLQNLGTCKTSLELILEL